MSPSTKKILDEIELKKRADELRRSSDDVLENVYELLMMNYPKKKQD